MTKKLNKQTKTLIPGLVHLVKDGDVVKYLLKNKDRLYMEGSKILGNNNCIPKQDLPIKMPGPEIMKESLNINFNELLDKVISFIKRYLEMPSESNYLILALWVFHTYLREKFNTTPILYFFGVKETGKTRAGEVLNEIAFMSERLTAPTEATLFRTADYFKTALIIDEIKLWGMNGNEEVARLIKSRYKKGIKVPRVNLNKKGENQIEYFDVFGPLVICTTESMPDAIESRCITFLMQKNSKVEVEKIIDNKQADELRNKLTIFRAKYLEQDLKETDQVARRRLNEIMMPLYKILMFIAPEREEAFKKTVQEIEYAKKEDERSSLEAETVQAIILYKNEEMFMTRSIAQELNKERIEIVRLSYKKVANIIKRLGFKKTRTAKERGFEIELKLLEKLALQYGLDYDTNDGCDTYDVSSTRHK